MDISQPTIFLDISSLHKNPLQGRLRPVFIENTSSGEENVLTVLQFNKFTPYSTGKLLKSPYWQRQLHLDAIHQPTKTNSPTTNFESLTIFLENLKNYVQSQETKPLVATNKKLVTYLSPSTRPKIVS